MRKILEEHTPSSKTTYADLEALASGICKIMSENAFDSSLLSSSDTSFDISSLLFLIRAVRLIFVLLFFNALICACRLADGEEMED